MGSNNSNQCSKRVIIHPGIDLALAVSAALAFERDYVLTEKCLIGIYHARTYSGIDSKSGEEVTLDLHQSETSIIVRPSAPKIEEETNKPDLASLVPEGMGK